MMIETTEMPFVVMGWVGPRITLSDGVGIPQLEGTILGVDMVHPIVTHEEFVAWLSRNLWSDQAAVWDGK